MARLFLGCSVALIVACGSFSSSNDGTNRSTPDGGALGTEDAGDVTKAAGTIALAAPQIDGTYTTTAETVVATSASVGAGHLLVAGVVWAYELSMATAPAMTVTDTAGNAWRNATAAANNDQANPNAGHCKAGAQVFYAANVKGGSDTVTVTTSQPTNTLFTFTLLEYTGIAAADPLAAFGSAIAPIEGSSIAMSTPLVLEAPKNVIVGSFIDTLGGQLTPGDGFLPRGSNTYLGSLVADDLPGGGPGTRTASAQRGSSQSDNCWAVAAAAFRAAE